jgi:hypothetical protein
MEDDFISPLSTLRLKKRKSTFRSFIEKFKDKQDKEDRETKRGSLDHNRIEDQKLKQMVAADVATSKKAGIFLLFFCFVFFFFRIIAPGFFNFSFLLLIAVH